MTSSDREFTVILLACVRIDVDVCTLNQVLVRKFIRLFLKIANHHVSLV